MNMKELNIKISQLDDELETLQIGTIEYMTVFREFLILQQEKIDRLLKKENRRVIFIKTIKQKGIK